MQQEEKDVFDDEVREYVQRITSRWQSVESQAMLASVVSATYTQNNFVANQ